MKIFVDTANIQEIEKLQAYNLIDGVTTNPSLIAHTKRPYQEVLKDISTIISSGPISAEVVATHYTNMMKEAEKLSTIAPNIVVKLPLTPDGLKACYTLREESIYINMTLCFSPLQALLAARAQATYVSPFIGRLDDYGHEGLSLIRKIKLIYKNYSEFKTQILAASLRTPFHVLKAAEMGADVITAPSDLIWKLFNHPLTDKGLDQFIKDWDTTSQTII